MKQLRRYEHVADKEHWCDRCCTYIQPGEYYEGLVCAENHKITVFKQHKYPCCEEPPNPDEENCLAKSLEKTLKIAA